MQYNLIIMSLMGISLYGDPIFAQYQISDFEEWSQSEEANHQPNVDAVHVDGMSIALISICYQRAWEEAALTGGVQGHFLAIEQREAEIRIDLVGKPLRTLFSDEVRQDNKPRVRCIFPMEADLITIQEDWHFEVLN